MSVIEKSLSWLEIFGQLESSLVAFPTIALPSNCVRLVRPRLPVFTLKESWQSKPENFMPSKLPTLPVGTLPKLQPPDWSPVHWLFVLSGDENF